ncbi:NAD-dependent epimerase/dehydratase family protein [Sphingobacterium sp. DR205]|uniref:NAD-dependent epimerase/dehydratase family protein n=1 Tax=Sphingobacterium sp. DR205 TaxID=2713573 RepID=UPI0013E43347|nr:NAD-dependent epimerase/dehydratase family protein [Sphingobacterium sp. DR205]QIH31574.1 NAD-dependent epimerase/dehydratase family protein [Sphingobacterium sp. DR205]
MSETVAIFGASGFVGKNLKSSFLNNTIRYEEISLRDLDWRHKFHSSQANVVINLVGKAHDHEQLGSKEEYFDVNLGLTQEIFSEFLKSNSDLFIQISSLAALEEVEAQIPLVETDGCNPISWYGLSKRAAEEWILKQKLVEGKKAIILRPPMIHGPGDKGNLGLLYGLLSKGIPYPLASFENKRSFLYINNFCFFIQLIIQNHDKLNTGIYHIADDDSISTKDIINTIRKVTGKSIPQISVPKSFIRFIAKVGDVVPIPLNTKRLKKMTSNLLLSTRKIKDALDITNSMISAKEGLEMTIRSFKDKKF